MPNDSGSHRTVHSGVHQTLTGVEVLVLDADKGVHEGIAQLLSEASLHVTCVSEAERALALVERQFFSVALVDIDTATPRDGIETISAIKAASPTTMVIAMTPRRSYDDAVDAVRAGAVDLILKAPESVAYLKDRVLAAAFRSVGKREVDTVLDEIKGVHEEFLQRFMETERRAIDLADQVAGRDSVACDEHGGSARPRRRRGSMTSSPRSKKRNRKASRSRTRPRVAKAWIGSRPVVITTR